MVKYASGWKWTGTAATAEKPFNVLRIDFDVEMIGEHATGDLVNDEGTVISSKGRGIAKLTITSMYSGEQTAGVFTADSVGDTGVAQKVSTVSNVYVAFARYESVSVSAWNGIAVSPRHARQ